MRTDPSSTVTPLQRKPFVYIVESPSNFDFLQQRLEGQILEKALSLAQIKTSHVIATNVETFRIALGDKLLQTWRGIPDSGVPIIHISAHGSSEGIGLTSGEFLSWDDLADLLRPINAAINGILFVCLSSCSGADGCQMAMDERDLPFCAMVSHRGTPTWSDTTVGFLTFYHLLFKGNRTLDQLVQAMRVASGDNDFLYLFALDSQRVWIEHIEKRKRDEALARMAEALAGAPTAPAEPSAGNSGDGA